MSESAAAEKTRSLRVGLDERIARAGLMIRRLQPTLGAEIGGVDLTKPLSAEVRDGIWAAFCKYEVVFFRDQNLTRQQHIAFGKSFRNLLPSPFNTDPEAPEILKVYSDGKVGADVWHTDNIDEKVPPSASILYAYKIPSLGGDTMFSSGSAVYRGLSTEMKERIDPLIAIHRTPDRRIKIADDPNAAGARKNARGVEHPVVRVHPETGERVVYVCELSAASIVGMSAEEGRDLIRFLSNEFKRPEYQLRFDWRVHSMAMWDNRSVQHYAVVDYNEQRNLERITLEGEPVLSVQAVG